MIKDNGDGSFTMGKVGRMVTFKLNEEWEESMGNNIQAKNICTLDGDTLTRVITVINSDKKMTMKVEPKENGGLLMTQIVGDVVATRNFTKA